LADQGNTEGNTEGNTIVDAGAPTPLAQAIDPPKKRKPPRHTPEQIAAKTKIVDAFVERFTARKGIAPKLVHAGDHHAAFAMAKTYGAEEGAAIVRRAFDDDFVAAKNATLRYIASKADTWRGEAMARAGRHQAQPAPATGSAWTVGTS
jgi:hypothetical protein